MPVTIFLCGDVMTGRGIDQALPHPSDPRIHEPYMRDARGYVEIAESAFGPIPRPVGFSYVWGGALAELERVKPDVRLINLETSITTSDDYWKGKGINYRMHPGNVPVLTAARIDAVSLANNHVLDWGYAGLSETIETLRKAKVKYAGAGRNSAEAEAPAMIETSGAGRVIFFSFGSETSGIPRAWAATADRPGVNLLSDLSDRAVSRIRQQVERVKRKGDVAVASIHWGPNWGYEIPREQRQFSRALIDEAGVDVIHGHSSHHPKGIEVYRGRPILYGCGDFLNDYEGISGYEFFRGDLGLMYFARMEAATGTLLELTMTPTQVRKFRVQRAGRGDAQWLGDVLSREGKALGTRVEIDKDNRLALRWD
jgi:poly-gamma-glutamate synthesis protein (capsule biosynthesis protein)